MEPEARPPAVRIADTDRQHAAELLQHACGEGRLTLEEFSVRVGAVWAADTSAELTEATAGLAGPTIVGQTIADERIVNVLGESKRHGRWRVPKNGLHLINVFGSCELDLRDAALGPDAMSTQVLAVEGRNVFGAIKIIVPEGVEVELTGASVFASRQQRLAPVPRLAGTPLVRIHLSNVFGEIKVYSQPPDTGSPLRRWLKGTYGA
jgi:hypothetical protein